jgi:hypothetical protein
MKRDRSVSVDAKKEAELSCSYLYGRVCQLHVWYTGRSPIDCESANLPPPSLLPPSKWLRTCVGRLVDILPGSLRRQSSSIKAGNAA